VLAAGRATIEAKGVTYTVVEPGLLDAGVALPLLPPRLRRTWQIYGGEHFLKVKRLPEVAKIKDGRPGDFIKAERRLSS
jgi:hypothetical protein